jgi:hypothetical protein
MYKLILCGAMAICPLTASFACAQTAPSPTPSRDEARLAAAVQVLSAAQMSTEDAAVLAAHREAISSAAEVNGYDIRSGSWIQNQVLCPNAPSHVLMHYLKISKDGSVSLFTAAVPRTQGGTHLRVRIIPVLYHGAPAFHVFGSIPSQRALIDEVIPAKPFASSKDGFDWTSLAYCYAALAGAEPASKSITAPEQTVPTLEQSTEGALREMRFTILGPEHLLQDWRIVLDRQARVKAIFLSTKPQSGPRPVPALPPLKQTPVPQNLSTQPQSGPQPIPASPPLKQTPVPQNLSTKPQSGPQPIPASPPLKQTPIPQKLSTKPRSGPQRIPASPPLKQTPVPQNLSTKPRSGPKPIPAAAPLKQNPVPQNR